MVVYKRYIILFIIFISTSFLFPENKNINIITTNDLHGKLSEQDAVFMNPNFPPKIIGASALSKYVDDLEKKNDIDDLLIFDGGNFFQGHPLGIIDSGRTIIKWMNKVGYDALVPGENDFVFGYENLIELNKISNFPFLASNFVYTNTKENIFDPYIVIDIDNIKVGVLGMIPSKLNELVLSKNFNNVEIVSEVVSLKKWTPILKSEGVDIIILLSSLGVPWERENIDSKFFNKNFKNNNFDKNNYKCNNSIELGYFCNDIDIMISGGVSKGYKTPMYNKNSHVYIFQNYGNGTEFGHFLLHFKGNDNLFTGYSTAVTNSISQTLFIDDFDYDENIYNWITNADNKSIHKIYSPIQWDSILLPDNNELISDDYIEESIWDVPEINPEYNHNIATWNCEFFPTANDSTLLALSEVISDLNIDIIAFQEIKKRGWFDKMMRLLPEYNYIISKQSSFMDQAIIYKKESYKLINSVELFAENDYNFAGRPPLRCDFIDILENKKISIINLHMKCCDSGLERRKKAAKMLYDYLDDNIENSGSNIIVLGDWNDDLKDKDNEHCFYDFLNDGRYFFPTLEITNDLSQASYPKAPYVSFLDHILVTSKIFKNKEYDIQTIRIDKLMGGFNIYESYISDHLPVLLSFN